ncbi:MAG: hypothetical protein E6K56_01925 [Ignavibacteria bacterium]|nr:MAG: hypothetical protein E6K56_01925 [Ignavibacteria bacterium]
MHFGFRISGLEFVEHFPQYQPMRLHPAEPFFCLAPQQIGDMEIAPDKPYVSRYRFIVADGPSDKVELERLWKTTLTLRL